MRSFALCVLLTFTVFLAEAFEVQQSVACEGHQDEIQICQKPVCAACVPQDCRYSVWSSWSTPSSSQYVGAMKCTGLCGRFRTIESEANECGAKCGGGAGVNLQETKRCDEQACSSIPYDCSFAAWGAWVGCSANSTAGQATRARTISQQASNGGRPCEGPMLETKPCIANQVASCTFVAWSDWSVCNNGCGTAGVSTRSRTVGHRASRVGQPCVGNTTQDKNCPVIACSSASPCVLGAWQQWSTCDTGGTITLGKSLGVRTRNRTSFSPAGNGGAPCSGVEKETEACGAEVPKDCIISPWTPWTTCDKDCGGGQHSRNRSVAIEATAGGSCGFFTSKETAACNVQNCSADCSVGLWSAWEACSVTCGQGERKRHRAFVDGQVGQAVNPKANRILCPEVVLTEMSPCQDTLCLSQDCQWSNLTYGPCSVTCGEGVKTGLRQVIKKPAAGGTCPSLANGDKIGDKIVAKCTLAPCPSTCRNGTWSDWADWSACSMSCGEAIRSRSRTVATDPDHCGYPPVGLKSEYAVCAGQAPCVPKADCVIGTWSTWSTCSNTCAGVHHRTRNITTPASGLGTKCPSVPMAEIEQCSKSKSLACSGQHDPIDCKLSEWKAVSACTVSCGGGYLTKNRSVIQPAAYGGEPCSALVSKLEACNSFSCPNGQCIDCQWNQWSDWGSCTSCSGQRERHRQLHTKGNYCGVKCDPANNVETSPCMGNVPECQGTVQYCTWGEWGSASPCPHACGFHAVTRARQLMKVITPEPTSYLTKASVHDTLTCAGHQVSNTWCGIVKCESAAAQTCTPQDCYPSEWSDWSAPNVGLCYRTRHISQFNACGGRPCNGTLEESKDCTTVKIPTDCLLDAWTQWSTCASKHLQSVRVRSIKRDVANGGYPCQGRLNETRPCDPDIKMPRDCNISTWSDWNVCSSSCYGGNQKRRRDIQDAAVWPGKPCDTSMEETRECNHNISCSAAPVNCSFTPWSQWGACIDNKQKVRNRNSVGGLSGGHLCQGPLSETQPCGQYKVDCVMGDWTMWGDCDLTCGTGTKDRHRQVVKQPKNGGKVCPPALVEVTPCTHNKGCTPRIDCDLTSWREWTYCTTTCGVGQKMRTRYVSNNRSNIGEGCSNTLMETRPCENRASCVADSVCRWSDWNTWSTCSNSCGGGMSSRNRHIIAAPKAGEDMLKRKCPPKTEEEVKKCSLGPCNVEACVNGSWNEWSDWQACSSTCSDGFTERHRTIKVPASKCGLPALGNSTESKQCQPSTICLIPIDCKFDDWQPWGACSAPCDGLHERSRLVKSYSINGGASCKGDTRQYASCNPSASTHGCIPAVLDKDCAISSWSAFTPCSVTCGGGQMKRNRVIVQPKVGLGKECNASLEHSTACNTQICNASMAPKDCQIGDWMDWAPCDQCGGNRERRRSVLVYAQFGGKPCSSTSLTDLGKCDRSCPADNLCIWGDWTVSAPCSVTCGNGTIKRTRKLQMVPRQLAAQALYEDDDLEAKVQQLYKESMNAKAQHTREVAMAFFVGCGCLLAVLKVSTSWDRKKTTTREFSSVPSRSRSRSREMTMAAPDDVERELVPFQSI